ncbi:MAG: class I SAM-dependent methyltransferase [Verrucomicrobiia bacterium]|jgi:2-polyprenyl-3-methyl-5-hydroxy-6-metoxy-1,4-benzoquinol methylase
MNQVLQWMMPRAFELFQFSVGGTVAKRNLVLQYYSNQKRILEVGCSVGNIAVAFRGRGVEYVGIDTDESAINYATKKFRCHTGFSFICGDLCCQRFQHSFDFIVFSGILHHLDDAAATRLLEFSKESLSPQGVVLVSDPIQPRPEDSALIKLYRKMERGKYVRNLEELSGLLTNVIGLQILQQECQSVTALPFFSKPRVSYFGVFVLGPRGLSSRVGIAEPLNSNGLV